MKKSPRLHVRTTKIIGDRMHNSKHLPIKDRILIYIPLTPFPLHPSFYALVNRED